MYSVNDKIFCPMHGAGIIDNIENIDLNGKLNKYYVISLIGSNMKIKVPVENESSLIRAITDKENAQIVLESIKLLEINETVNWTKRYRENMDRLKTGDMLETAKVLKALIIRNKTKTLSAGERKMLHSTKQILISELVLALDKDSIEIEEYIYDAIG